MNNKLKEIILIIISFIVGGLVMLLIVLCTPLINVKDINSNRRINVFDKSSLSTSISKIYDAVVLVQGYNNDLPGNNGTGFVYKVDNKYGYILTNEHVVSKGNDIKVTFTNDEVVTTEVLGKDEYLDLAILRVPKKYVSQVAILGNSNHTNIGDIVFTVGSPLGSTYRGSVTSGILSGKDRYIPLSVNTTSTNDWVMKVLQVDAAINPGNSGGPLLNVNGEVIGICTMKLVDEDVEGMGFAIPIEYAMNYVTTLETEGKMNWPVIGIDIANTDETSTLIRNNISTNIIQEEGVVVLESIKGIDLRKGDIITKINNKKVKDTAYLRYELYNYKVNDKIEITYIRNGQEHKTKITLKAS